MEWNLAGKVHPVSYFVSCRDRMRRLRLHQRRDEGACLELLPALLEQGWRYGEPILNTPPPPGSGNGRGNGRTTALAVDLSFVRAGDLLLQTTRPPCHDLEHGDRKRVERGETDLEARLFERWERYLEICARSHVKLARGVRGELARGFESRREMVFLEKPGAPYKRLNALEGAGFVRPPRGPRTALFLLRVDAIWPGGPGLLAAFGMDGISTLVWAYRLGRDLRGLLAEQGFVMAELTLGEIPERPTDLRWAADWPVEVVLRAAV